MEQLIGRVIFVDINGIGIHGAAVGRVDELCCGIGEGLPICQNWIDLLVASPEKAVKEISKHSGLTDGGIGLGDVVEKVAGLFGVKPCSGCMRRKEKFNKIKLFG